MADGACLYFQWHFALRGRQRGKKCTANKAFKCTFFCLLQTQRGYLWEPYPLFILPCNVKTKYNVLIQKYVCISFDLLVMSLKRLTVLKLHLVSLSFIMSSISGQEAQEEGFLLWPTVKGLEQNGWSQVAWGLSQFHGREVWGTMQQKYSTFWTTVTLEKPLDLLFTSQILCSLFQPSVSQARSPHQNVLRLRTVTKCRWAGERRKVVRFVRLLWWQHTDGALWEATGSKCRCGV